MSKTLTFSLQNDFNKCDNKWSAECGNKLAASCVSISVHFQLIMFDQYKLPAIKGQLRKVRGFPFGQEIDSLTRIVLHNSNTIIGVLRHITVTDVLQLSTFMVTPL